MGDEKSLLPGRNKNQYGFRVNLQVDVELRTKHKLSIMNEKLFDSFSLDLIDYNEVVPRNLGEDN